MSAKYVRISASNTNPDKRGDYLFFDLRMKDGEVSNRLPIFGLQLNGEERMPFFIEADGRADYGVTYPEKDRYMTTDLFRIEIVPLSIITVASHDFSDTYLIDWVKEIDDLF